ncbi:MAG: hypothetical protein RSF33_03825 [Hydrogenoanaerobacterium sp.]
MKLIEYKSPPTARKIAAVVFAVALAARILLLGLSLFFGYEISGKATLPLINLIILLAAFPIIKNHKALLASVCGILMILNLGYLLVCNDGAEYYFASPNKQNTLVVREKSALLSGGWAKLYKRDHLLFLKPLGEAVGTDESYQPFSHGQYRIEWSSENTVAVYYYDGYGYKRLDITL